MTLLDETQRAALRRVIEETFPECSDPEWRAHQIEMIGMGSSARLFGQFREHEKLNELLESVEKTQELLSSLSGESRQSLYFTFQFHDDISDGEEFVGRPLEALRRCIKGHLKFVQSSGGVRAFSKATEHRNWQQVGVAHMCWQIWAREKLKLGQNGQAVDELPPWVNNNAKKPPFGIFVRDVFRACSLVDEDEMRLSQVASAIKAIHQLS